MIHVHILLNAVDNTEYTTVHVNALNGASSL